MTDSPHVQFPEGLIGRSFDGWEIQREKGRGRSAVVFRATRAGEVAAVKVYSPELQKRFGEEKQSKRIERQLSLRGHDHPYLVQTYSGGKDPDTGLLYLVMEHLEGRPLNEVLQSLPVERIAPLLAQIAEAAEFLESMHIVHRDIKPSNIVVDREFRKATLLDLGVIRPLLDSDLTDGTGIHPFLGTLRYSSPEFLFRREKQTRDGWRGVTFYQLGAVVHDLVTGRRLFAHVPDEAWPELVRTIENETPDLSPGRIRAGVDPRLVELAEICLRKDWEERVNALTWKDFSCRRFVRRPVVVMLYTGGTVGATVTNDRSETRSLRPILDVRDPLLHAFHDRVLRDYEQLSGPELPIPFDLEPEILPVEQQMLSENARFETWNHLAEAVERISDRYAYAADASRGQEGSYLAGIVLLHGTDTLAYSAAALSLALRNLPCPVVLTGSNQPPNEKSIYEQDLIASQSDAWKNILRSLQFIYTLGHRFTEVFVCFGDTVHVAINLRKSPNDRSPQPVQGERRLIQEPYFFRNQGPSRQYMYRVIDGLYCNNFYPIPGGLTYDLLIHDPSNRYRHVRQSALTPTSQRLRRASFAPGVWQESVTPVPPDRGYATQRARAKLAGARVLLLEGYNSGTFPTAEQHPFTRFLRATLRASIPLVLVTESGLIPSQKEYEKSRVDGIEVPVLRLLGLIVETAAPLLSMTLAEIPDEEWSPAELSDPYRLLLHRHATLERRLRQRHSESKGILSALLGSILDEQDQYKKLVDEINRDDRDYTNRVTDLFAEARGKRPRVRTPRTSFERSKTVLLRQHFLWILLEMVRPYEVSRCGPDGLALPNEMGFSWGQRVYEALLEGRSNEGPTPLARQPAGRQEELIGVAKARIRTVTEFLFGYGVADVTTEIDAIPPSETRGYSDGSFTLRVDARKHGRGGRNDDLFATLGYREREAEFFRSMRSGSDLRLFDAECATQVEASYRELYERAWEAKVSPLDWFLIGTYKAVACRALLDLRFDPWTERCNKDDVNYLSALRQSIRIQRLIANRTTLSFVLRYAGRAIVSRRQDLE